MATVPTTSSVYTQINNPPQPTPRVVSPVTPSKPGTAGVPVGDASKANSALGDLVTAGIPAASPTNNGVAPGNQTQGVMPVQQAAYTLIQNQAGG